MPIGTGHLHSCSGEYYTLENQHSIYLFRLVGAVSLEKVEGIPTDRFSGDKVTVNTKPAPSRENLTAESVDQNREPDKQKESST